MKMGNERFYIMIVPHELALTYIFGSWVISANIENIFVTSSMLQERVSLKDWGNRRGSHCFISDTSCWISDW